MNSLSNTYTYASFSKFIRLNDIFQEGFESFQIPWELIESKIPEFSRYKFPLTPYTKKVVSEKKIIPILFDEPIKPGVKFIPNTNPLFYFPKGIGVKNGVPSDIVVYGNVFRSKYVKNNTTGKPEYLNVDMRDFYGIMQTCAVIRGIKLNDAKFTNAVQLHKLLSSIYSELIVKAINGNRRWSVGVSDDRIAVLKFLATVFYFEQMVEKNKEKAIEMALSTFQSLDRSYIESFCNYVKDDNFDISAAPFKKRTSKIVEFINVIKEQFPEISDFSYPNFMLIFREMYGDNALFIVEDFCSFVTILQLVHLNYSFVKDRVIMSNQLINRYLNEAMKKIGELLI